jgi:hypothetical protein
MENKLRYYNGYIPNTVNKWKKQFEPAHNIADKILNQLHILKSRNIRDLLRNTVQKHRKLLDSDNTRICKFGPIGKSGDILIYEFSHTFRQYRGKIIESWEIPNLSPNSNIVFLDDLIGTGQQSETYITEKLYLLLNPSHKAYLLCICATPQGIERIKKNTCFKPIATFILEEKSHQHFSNKCNIFTEEEKTYLRHISQKLQNPERSYYIKLGLLLAFYFTVPNNTLPIIWKDNAPYEDDSGNQRRWRALLPRDY